MSIHNVKDCMQDESNAGWCPPLEILTTLRCWGKSIAPGKPGLWIQNSFSLWFQILSSCCQIVEDMHRVELRSLHKPRSSNSSYEVTGSVLSKHKPCTFETIEKFVGLQLLILLWSYQHEAAVVKSQIKMDSRQQYESFIIPFLLIYQDID